MIVIVVGFVGRLLGFAIFGVGVFGLDHVDADLAEHRQRVFDLLGGHFLRRHHGIELFIGDIAALLGGLDHLLDAGVVKVEQRQRRVRGAFGFFLAGSFSFASAAFAFVAISFS